MCTSVCICVPVRGAAFAHTRSTRSTRSPAPSSVQQHLCHGVLSAPPVAAHKGRCTKVGTAICLAEDKDVRSPNRRFLYTMSSLNPSRAAKMPGQGAKNTDEAQTEAPQPGSMQKQPQNTPATATPSTPATATNGAGAAPADKLPPTVKRPQFQGATRPIHPAMRKGVAHAATPGNTPNSLEKLTRRIASNLLGENNGQSPNGMGGGRIAPSYE